MSIGATYYNTPYTDARYVGHMHGTSCGSYSACHTNTTSSTAKNFIDSWYTYNISNKGSNVVNKIANVIYCNDRTRSSSETTLNNANGYSTLDTYFGPFIRTLNHQHPTFKCTNVNDQFTLKVANGGTSGYGNNAFTYPIALSTIDEAVFAGASFGYNNSEYLFYGHLGYAMQTMSPAYYIDRAGIYYVTTSLAASGMQYNDYPIRPVIALNSAIAISGDGSKTSPYIIE